MLVRLRIYYISDASRLYVGKNAALVVPVLNLNLRRTLLANTILGIAGWVLELNVLVLILLEFLVEGPHIFIHVIVLIYYFLLLVVINSFGSLGCRESTLVASCRCVRVAPDIITVL